MIRIKRAYDDPTTNDGLRILVDRIWPRGLSKEKAHLAKWLKEIAPSTELRQWFNHDPEKWQEFQHKYTLELRHNAALHELEQLAHQQTITLIYAAKDTQHNNAVVLQQILSEKLE
ncbi:DUF488 domain-containing protein [Acinetobacter ursingii]|uniref:DUF488 domain-containing protein n=1 Tax=Acinetobacter ursingii TaxID=108980 RepID=UPI00300854AB